MTLPFAAAPGDLLARYEALQTRSPQPLRARDAAEALGASEGALAEARRAAGASVPLRKPEGEEGYAALLAGMGAVGEAMALTRNAHCVHEKVGTYAAPSFHGGPAQTLGEIDLRLFFSHWRAAYAVSEATKGGPRRSIQIFDPHGDAIHKIYTKPASDEAAFAALIDRFADPDAEPVAFSPAPAPAPERPDAEIDAEALRAGWAAHSHDFFGLLRRCGVSRAQAMRLGGPGFARPLAPQAAQAALEGAAAQAVPLMIFVGNRGCVQIHSGPVEKIVVMGPWLNVLDARFNLHLRADRIAAAFAVRKPSLRGDVHSVELFDADGFCFCQIFGERPPGQTERPDWRALIAALPEAGSC